MKIKRHCKNCNTYFECFPYQIKSGRGIYCSRECSDKNSKVCLRKRTTQYCKCCNKKFETVTSRIKKYGYGKFCDDSCRLQYIHNQSIKNIIQRKCQFCNKMFESTINKKSAFCSRICARAGGRRRQPKKLIKINCKYCNKEFHAWPAEIQKSGKKFCSKNCRVLDMINKISLGNHINHGNFKTGYYKSILSNNNEYHDSSYELLRMKQLDNNGKTWTKKHGIKIPYKDKNNKIHHYIPDFLIDNKIIEEVKPKNLINSNYLNTKIKLKAGKKYCKENGYQFRIITEKELGIK